MIKVKLPFRWKCFDGECVWVKPLTYNTGEISNLPVFATRYTYKDIVKFDLGTGEFLGKVAEGGFTRTAVFRYTGEFPQEKAYWESKGYIVESLAPGIVAVSRRRSKKALGGK